MWLHWSPETPLDNSIEIRAGIRVRTVIDNMNCMVVHVIYGTVSVNRKPLSNNNNPQEVEESQFTCGCP